MTLATREDFLKPIPLNEFEGEVKPIGNVRMRQLNGADYFNSYQKWFMPKGEVDNKRFKKRFSKLVTLCIVDENNEPILTDDDIDRIEEMPNQVREKLHTEALRIHGLMFEDGEENELGNE